MKLIEVVILAGSHCLSPLQSGDGLTEAGKVPCAVLIRQDPETQAVQIIPRGAATDPQVIALLMKSAASPASSPPQQAKQEMSPSPPVPADLPMPRPRPVVVASDEGRTDAIETGSLSGAKFQSREPAGRAAASQNKATVRRTDSCGSYKAVWYTNKQGRRKYRCVKVG